jgi:hypothetical protein
MVALDMVALDMVALDMVALDNGEMIAIKDGKVI